MELWSRRMLKERAKGVLRFNYWKAFVVSLVLALIGARSSGGNFTYRYGYNNNNIFANSESLLYFLKIAAIMTIVSLILIIIRIFAGYMLEVGGRKFFVRAAEGETNMCYLGYCFQEGRYFNVLTTMLLKGVYTFLWTLLLIIPGIVKSYAYRMVPYILADNPSIGQSRAIQLSKDMTYGNKWNMFALDLSFIGWYLLGALALLIGVLFVNPYVDSTFAQLYLILRRNAIKQGITSTAELNLNEEQKW